EIKGISCNSKSVGSGFAFVAVKGNSGDGNDYIGEALARGAGVIVTEKGSGNAARGKGHRAAFLKVENCRKFLAESCAQFYGYPSRGMRVCGVTGTNGKTTISYLIEAISEKLGRGCGVIGTVNYRFGGRRIAASNTTPGPVELQSLLARMRGHGMKYCVMEVSSHALAQERVLGVDFKEAIFTNLTQDHLDYHDNMEEYFSAKKRLFGLLPSSGTAIINNDDPYGRRLKKTSCRLITYGIKNKSDFMAKGTFSSLRGSEFVLSGEGRETNIRTRLIGRHNIYNILAAVSWARAEGIAMKRVKEAVEGLRNVPGRLEKMKGGKDIFVDYAHTPDALYNVLGSLRPLVKGRLVVVFGCGGERDSKKRPLMGRIASRLADFVYLTDDNPRSEDPVKIIRDIRSGMPDDNYLVIPDRYKAIKDGIKSLKGGDCLVVAGKGHEEYQLIKGRKRHFSDREAVNKCLSRKR
ncbi:MAG: UDP-N-acetylmuramoyl-L-alanyl-D-glutamate--2,6-diaminopimelate ligase, partial [Candidatus Omnitrophica bacterium]|nr:UDP-N-acetylmuramoyl-L-alanyl-D-glutamate--2,6-diaminopimelate ligase [Candidatus Omnitrophota bacterium]